MKFKIIFIMTFLLILLPFISANDQSLTTTCGGDSGLVIHCIGDAELNSLGFGVIEQNVGGGKTIIEPKMNILTYCLLILALLLIAFVCLIIAKKKRKA